MADRSQDRRLDRVAQAQPLSLERLSLEHLSVGGHREQRRQRREKTVSHRGVRLLTLGHDEPSDQPVSGAEVELCPVGNRLTPVVEVETYLG